MSEWKQFASRNAIFAYCKLPLITQHLWLRARRELRVILLFFLVDPITVLRKCLQTNTDRLLNKIKVAEEEIICYNLRHQCVYQWICFELTKRWLEKLSAIRRIQRSQPKLPAIQFFASFWKFISFMTSNKLEGKCSYILKCITSESDYLELHQVVWHHSFGLPTVSLEPRFSWALSLNSSCNKTESCQLRE